MEYLRAYRGIIRPILFVTFWGLAIWPSASVALEPDLLRDGGTYVIVPPDTECVEIIRKDPERAVQLSVDAVCDETAGTLYVLAEFGSLLARTGSGLAVARTRYFFTVDEVPGASEQSFVPIHIVVPVDWVYRLRNNELTGVINTSSGSATLRLWENPVGASNGRGTRVVGTSQIMSAAHLGLSGCLTLPTGAVAAVEMALKCVAASFMRLNGTNIATISAVVEVGRTYNVELEIRADVQKRTRGSVRLRAESANSFNSHPGLNWNRMTIAVGTDPLQIVAGLQRQIDELREDLESHTHNYLTGRGRGHNKVLAVSSPAIIPGESADGKTVEELQSGPVTGRPASRPGNSGSTPSAIRSGSRDD